MYAAFKQHHYAGPGNHFCKWKNFNFVLYERGRFCLEYFCTVFFLSTESYFSQWIDLYGEIALLMGLKIRRTSYL